MGGKEPGHPQPVPPGYRGVFSLDAGRGGHQRAGDRLQGTSAGGVSASVNAKLAAINGFFAFLGRHDLRVKQLKIQRQAFCSRERELSKTEYLRLVRTAEARHSDRLSLMIQTICATGIRVSELHSITAEAVERGEAVIQLKGKTRVILLSGKLRKKRQRYLHRRGGRSGPAFVTRTGRPLDRSSIGRGGEQQGLSAQPAAPLCALLLRHRPGSGKAGRYFGTLQHQHHPHLHHLFRQRTPPADGRPAVGVIETKKLHNLHYVVNGKPIFFNFLFILPFSSCHSQGLLGCFSDLRTKRKPAELCFQRAW